MIDFIGIGAQKAGTSWIYACLYEHPEICAPIKERHFFSKDENYNKGLDWYLAPFKKCKDETLKGEYSTSYLSSDVAPDRIKKHFPDAKIIMSLRNPIKRAFSQFKNAKKAGEIEGGTSFRDFLNNSDSIKRGMYSSKLQRYRELFGEDNVLVLLYEDSLENPEGFIKRIYKFLGINDKFMPSMIRRKINTDRKPRFIFIDKIIMFIAEGLRKTGLDRLVWFVKKSGLPKKIRSFNTVPDQEDEMSDQDLKYLRGVFRDDIQRLSSMVNRDLTSFWGF